MSPAVSCFGKLPAALDFVRIRLDSPQAIQLDRWFERAVQRLAARGKPWPAEPLRFMFSGSAGSEALVGVAVPSRDRAGRRFPLAVFTRCACDGNRAALPLAAEGFLAAAEALLAQSAEYDAAQLTTALLRLPTPELGELRSARVELQRRLDTQEPAELAHALFGADAQGAALSTLLALCEFRASGARELAFECPIATTLDCGVWLCLSELALSSTPPSCLWQLGSPLGRMLLANGPLPESAPLTWTLGTPRRRPPRAREAAWQTHTTLSALFAELTRRSA